MLKKVFWRIIGLVIIVSTLLSDKAQSHCDTMNGPVVKDAKLALVKGDVTPVLKWVKLEYEAEVRQLFEKTRAVREKGADIREIADMHFFETVVRLHRAGEGEPFTGLKPEGTVVEPGIEAADQALEKGRIEEVIKKTSDEIAEGIRSRFGRVQEAKKHADQSIESGRQFVAAYVEFIHFIESIHQTATAREVDNTGKQDSHHNDLQ